MPRSLLAAGRFRPGPRRAIFLWGREAPFLARPEARERAKVSRQSVITPEGLEKLRDEIQHTLDHRQAAGGRRTDQGRREFGDISENAEYDDAKNEQALLEQRSPSSRSGCAAPP